MAGAVAAPALAASGPKHNFGIRGDRFVLDGNPS